MTGPGEPSYRSFPTTEASSSTLPSSLVESVLGSDSESIDQHEGADETGLTEEIAERLRFPSIQGEVESRRSTGNRSNQTTPEVRNPPQEQPTNSQILNLAADFRLVQQLRSNARVLRNMATRPPRRGARDAPSFDGSKPLELPRFLEDVEMIVDDAGFMDDASKLKYALYYASTEVVELWKTIPEVGARNPDWDTIKKKMKEHYPVLEEGKRYSRGDLEQIAIEWAEKGIRNRDELGEYRRAFTTRYNYLLARNKMSEYEAEHIFLRAFTGDLRTAVLRKLEITQPDHEEGDPYEVEKVVAQANLILGGTAYRNASSTSTPQGGSSTTSASKVKQEDVNLSTIMNTLKSFQVQIDSLARGPSSAPPFRPTQQSNPRPAGCAFCGEIGHYIRQCPRVPDFIQAGKCVRDAQGKILLPNGNFVHSGIPGRNLMERVDNYHRSLGGQNNGQASNDAHIASNSISFFDVSAQPAAEPRDSQVMFADSVEEEESDKEVDIEVERLEVLLNEAKKKTANNRRGKQEAAKDRPKAREKQSAAQPSTSSQVAPTPPRAPKPNDITKAPPVQPQFKFISGIEDPAIVKSVIDRSLDAPVTISQRELLALAPDVRKKIKDLTTTKKVTNNNVNYMEAAGDDESNASERPLVVYAESENRQNIIWESLPLRTMEGVIEDKIKAELTLDQGASCCLMREDVWKRIGTHLHPNETTLLETADLGVTRTIGKIPNVKLTIGGIDFNLPMHVVTDGPFLILIGRPFFAASECETKDYATGEQLVTISDPQNRNNKSMIATGSRTVGRPVLQPDFQ